MKANVNKKGFCFASACDMSDEYAKTLNSIDGFQAVTIDQRSATPILIFDTLNNAKIARNVMESKGYKCGNNIMNCEWNSIMVTITTVAEG